LLAGVVLLWLILPILILISILFLIACIRKETGDLKKVIFCCFYEDERPPVIVTQSPDELQPTANEDIILNPLSNNDINVEQERNSEVSKPPDTKQNLNIHEVENSFVNSEQTGLKQSSHFVDTQNNNSTMKVDVQGRPTFYFSTFSC
jgi:hypothetical protein